MQVSPASQWWGEPGRDLFFGSEQETTTRERRKQRTLKSKTKSLHSQYRKEGLHYTAWANTDYITTTDLLDSYISQTKQLCSKDMWKNTNATRYFIGKAGSLLYPWAKKNLLQLSHLMIPASIQKMQENVLHLWTDDIFQFLTKAPQTAHDSHCWLLYRSWKAQKVLEFYWSSYKNFLDAVAGLPPPQMVTEVLQIFLLYISVFLILPLHQKYCSKRAVRGLSTSGWLLSNISKLLQGLLWSTATSSYLNHSNQLPQVPLKSQPVPQDLWQRCTEPWGERLPWLVFFL